MGKWLSAEPGLFPADAVQIPSGQRDDNRRGGEEAVEKGRNRTIARTLAHDSTRQCANVRALKMPYI